MNRFSCKVCGAEPDSDGIIEHGKGCYHVCEEGGGMEYCGKPIRTEEIKAKLEDIEQRIRIEPANGWTNLRELLEQWHIHKTALIEKLTETNKTT